SEQDPSIEVLEQAAAVQREDARGEVVDHGFPSRESAAVGAYIGLRQFDGEERADRLFGIAVAVSGLMRPGLALCTGRGFGAGRLRGLDAVELDAAADVLQPAHAQVAENDR